MGLMNLRLPLTTPTIFTAIINTVYVDTLRRLLLSPGGSRSRQGTAIARYHLPENSSVEVAVTGRQSAGQRDFIKYGANGWRTSSRLSAGLGTSGKIILAIAATDRAGNRDEKRRIIHCSG